METNKHFIHLRLLDDDGEVIRGDVFGIGIEKCKDLNLMELGFDMNYNESGGFTFSRDFEKYMLDNYIDLVKVFSQIK